MGRHAALALVLLLAGCRSLFLITPRTAEALDALLIDERRRAAVPAADAYDRPHLLCAGELRRERVAPHAGRLWISAPDRPRSPGLRTAGVVIAVAGLAVAIAGAAVAGRTCPSEEAERAGVFGCVADTVDGLDILGVGLGTGAVGAILSAVGATGHPAEVPPGQPGVLYLP